MEAEKADYKAMYLKMFRAAEDAIKILTDAQLECEELYVSAGEDNTPQADDRRDAQNR